MLKLVVSLIIVPVGRDVPVRVGPWRSPVVVAVVTSVTVVRPATVALVSAAVAVLLPVSVAVLVPAAVAVLLPALVTSAAALVPVLVAPRVTIC